MQEQVTRARPWRPMTYVIDYTHRDWFQPDAGQAMLDALRSAPPELLHLGHDGPFVNHWGAVCLDGAGNQVLASPDDIRRRADNIRAFIEHAHGLGIKTVIMYICNQTLAGDPDKRTGIWQFYDRWDDYRDFGFGEKPPDPIEWMAREPSGALHYNYEKRIRFFAQHDHFRYAPCVNNPHYQQYLSALVLNLAQAGYDGLFVDNCILNCYCQYCQQGFRQRIVGAHSPSELRRRFGFTSTAEVTMAWRGSRIGFIKQEPSFREFLQRALDAEQKIEWTGTEDMSAAPLEEAGNGWLFRAASLWKRWAESTRPRSEGDLGRWGVRGDEDLALWVETKRFWNESMAANLRMIREAAAPVRPDFFILPNWGGMQGPVEYEFREEIGHDLETWQPHSDAQMFEEGSGLGMVAPAWYMDHIFQGKYARAARVFPVFISEKASGDAACEIAFSQANAQCGSYVQPGTSRPEMRRRWRDFHEATAAVWQNAQPYYEAAVLFDPAEFHHENHEHIRQTYRLARCLSDQQVLFEFLLPGRLEQGLSPDCQVAFLVDAARLTDGQLAALQEWVKQGGVAFIAGETGTWDLAGRRRAAAHLPWSSKTATGEGHWVRFKTGGEMLPPGGLSAEDGWEVGREQKEPFPVMRDLDVVVPVERFIEAGPLGQRLQKDLGLSLSIADPYAAQGLRFQAYIKPPSDGALFCLHVVNYNVPLDVPPDKRTFTPVRDLPITLRLPFDWQAQSARILSPSAPEQPVSISGGEEPEIAKLTIPVVESYALVLIEAAVRGPAVTPA